MFLKKRNISSRIKRSKVTEYAALKESCIGSSESTLVEMPHCWKSHVAAQIILISEHAEYAFYVSMTVDIVDI